MMRVAALLLALAALPVLVQGPAAVLWSLSPDACSLCTAQAAAQQKPLPACCRKHGADAERTAVQKIEGARHCCCRSAPLDVSTTAGVATTVSAKAGDELPLADAAFTAEPIVLSDAHPFTGPPPGAETVSPPGRPLYLRHLVLLT